MTPALPLLALGGGFLVAVAVRGRRSKRGAPLVCTAWAIPSPVPADVAKRAAQILASGPDYGATFFEVWDGQLFKFKVETHGANAQNPKPHKGVGVRACVGTDVPEGS